MVEIMIQRNIPRHYLLGDLERLLDFAGLGVRRPRFGLGDLDGDRDPDPPLLGGGDRPLGGDRPRGGDLLRGGDLPLYPLGEGPRRLGGDLLQEPLRPLKGGGGPRLPRGDGGLPPRRGGDGFLTALVVNRKRAVITLPSICPPSMAMRAFSASSCFSNSTYANPRGRFTFLSIAISTLFTVPNVPKIS